MKFLKSMSWILVLAFLIVLVQSAVVFAEAQSVEVGDFTISVTDGSAVLTEGEDYSFEDGELVINTVIPVTVGMKTGVETIDNTIRILTTNGSSDITFDNIDILSSSDFYAVQINGMVNGQKVTGDYPCVIRLVGTNKIKNTYSFGYGMRIYGENSDLTLTSAEGGSFNVSNSGSNGAVVFADGAGLTVCGNAEIFATSNKDSAFDNCGATTISENAKVKISAKYAGLVSDNKSDDNVTVCDNAVVDITAVSSGIKTENSVTVSDNAKLSIEGDGSGVAGIRAEKEIVISDYAEVTATNTGAYGMRSYDASVTISDNAKVSVDTVSGSGIYAETTLRISDNSEVTVKNAEDFGAAGSKGGFQLSGNVKFKATNVGTGLYSASDSDATIISDFVQITVDGDSKTGIKFNGEKDVEFSISGSPVVDVVSGRFGSGIFFGKTSAIVKGSPEITVSASGEYNSGLYSSVDGTLVVEGDSDITISGVCEDVVKGDIILKGNAVITANVVSEYGIDGNITMSENAKAIVEQATERGVNGNVYLGGNAVFEMNSVGEEGIYGELIIEDNGKITVFAVGNDKVLRNSFTVIPSDGMGYKVSVGETKENAEDLYYAIETLVPQKSKWRYFHAESTDSIPVTITVNDENTVAVFGEEIDLTALFSIDPNAGKAVYTVTAVTGEGVQNDDRLSVAKSGTFNVKVVTGRNGVYAVGDAEAVLNVNKAVHVIEGANIPTAERIRRGRLLADSEITPTELKDLDGSVLGSFAWVNPDEEMSEKGDFVKQVKFTPTDSDNYAEQFFDVNVTVFVSSGVSGNSDSSGASETYIVTFDSNGGSEVESVTANKNAWLKKPGNPVKEGYIFGGWFTDEELKDEYVFTSRVTSSFTLYAKWEEDENYIPDDSENGSESGDECDGTAADDCPSLAFDDLDVNEWYHLDTDYVIEKGLFNGVTEASFAPSGNMTRAMLVTVLYRNEGEPAVNRSIPFGDVDMGMYYANAVIWAKQNGIVKGVTETEFAPDENITREQIAAIIHRYAQFKGYDVSVGEDTNILSYADYERISEYAIPSMQYAVGCGIIRGKSVTTLNPQDNATRAELAAILHRFIKM